MICSDIWHKYHEWYFEIVIFETISKYHEWYLRQISGTNHAIICLYYYPQKVCNFTCRHFKLSWNTTALSQSNCRNFSCSSINEDIASPPPITKLPKTSCWKKPWKELFGFQLRQSASRACSSSYLQLRSSSGRSHTSVNVYNFGNLFSISLSIKKSNMYNLITASHFFSAGSSPACIQVVDITVSKQVHSRSQCYVLIRLSVDKNSFTCLLSRFQFQLCLRPRFLLLFGLSFKSLDVMILLQLNNNGKNRYISRKRANDCFSVYVF